MYLPVYEEPPSHSPSPSAEAAYVIIPEEEPSASPEAAYVIVPEPYPEADAMHARAAGAATGAQKATVVDAAAPKAAFARNAVIGASAFAGIGLVGAVVFVKRRRSVAAQRGAKGTVKDEEYDGSRNASMPKIGKKHEKPGVAMFKKKLAGAAGGARLEDSVSLESSFSSSRKSGESAARERVGTPKA